MNPVFAGLDLLHFYYNKSGVGNVAFNARLGVRKNHVVFVDFVNVAFSGAKLICHGQSVVSDRPCAIGCDFATIGSPMDNDFFIFC